ncbi:hypothetical protein PACTADRAFT_34252 [Pachysolen tannophilus NRRL Y-2460]|uniref:12 kDa heat shock protein n=1 Tax=Pachysolen tannophilus NRRL Y-2460 TaxID=669874 RepID=A0A1E4TVD4_PACTA|nr:hypothetical protein PACTADRAFT_34252 [Pachysolen tannophilus NRRL Y-2460]
MSDTGRKNLSDKVTESVKPDSEKTYVEKAKEKATDAYDTIAKEVQPDNNKSFGQTVGDAVESGKSKASGDASLTDTAQEYLNSAKGKLGEAVEYLSGSAAGAKEGAQSGAEKVADDVKK